MLYADRFSGHIEYGDPRTPVTAAGACIWPTIPPHRFLLQSEDTSGVLDVFSAPGVLIEKVTPGDAHNFCSWGLVVPVPGIVSLTLQKQRLYTPHRYRWYFSMWILGCGAVDKLIYRPVERCNRDVPIGSLGWGGTCGWTGDSFTAYQVEWNETQPPT